MHQPVEVRTHSNAERVIALPGLVACMFFMSSWDGEDTCCPCDMRGVRTCSQVWGTGVKMEMLLRTMGLSRAADTLVGNNLIRGVSGGERKRVTSAEHLVGPKVQSKP